MERRRAGSAALVAYVVLAAVNVAAQLIDARALILGSYLLLMPLLVAAVRLLTRERGWLVVLTLVGLIWSWFGDWAGQVLVVKIALFLLAQLAYALAFAPSWRRSVLTRPGWLLAYGLLITVIVVSLAGRAGSLAPLVAAYGVGLGVMVVLATGLNRTVALGALLFLLSDVVLGVTLFVDPEPVPAAQALNSALYLPAQLLIAVGVVRYAGHPSRRPPDWTVRRPR